MPAGGFGCPECMGVDVYDRELGKALEIVRKRIADGKIITNEIDAFAQMVYDLQQACAWELFYSNISTLVDIVRGQISDGEVPTVVPFHSVHFPMDRKMVADIARLHSEDRERSAVGMNPKKLWDSEMLKRNNRGERLRIGYVSADFVNHPTADLMQSALLLHDQTSFEIFLYSISRDDTSMYRQVLQREIKNFKALPNKLSDKKCAEMIRDDRIHILVNLNSHTAGERNGIFAHRPAPVQVVYLAYPGTHGASYLDYNVVDRTVSPEEHRDHYRERLVYMPQCYQTNSFKDLYGEILRKHLLPSRHEHGLPAKGVVFCTFNRLGRITPGVFHAWTEILKRVPNSVIWLYKHPNTAVLRLLEAARKAGIDASRFCFAGPVMPKIEHLKRLTLADVYLDTLVYNGHTTGSDVLWAGVPMVTIQGDTFPSRVGASLARAIEMPEMIATTMEEYVDKAVELGTDPAKLRAMRERLEGKRLSAPLFDTKRWVESFEDALQTMWSNHEAEQAGQTSASDIFPHDPGNRHQYGVCDTSDRSSKKWKEEKGDAVTMPARAPVVRTLPLG